MPTLTVLICTHNRRPLLQKALDSLDRCRMPAGWTVRIHVMANACSDDTLDWLARRSGRLPLSVDHEPRPGKSKRRSHAPSNRAGSWCSAAGVTAPTSHRR